MTDDRTMESRVRRLAHKHNCHISKSRDRHMHSNNYGEYMLVDSYRNYCLLGANYDATLEDIRDYLVVQDVHQAIKEVSDDHKPKLVRQ